MSNLFQNLEVEAFRKGITPRTKQSREWFRRKVSELSRVNRRSLMREDPIKNKTAPEPGDMYMYYYDPKHKKTLPYYDRFPLVVMSGPAPGGFYGLNLHYLPPVLRAKFFDALMDNTTNKKFDESTKIRADYQLLQALSSTPYYEACFKHYLTDHVQSAFAYVPPPEWEIALFMPTALWSKANQATVWRESRRKL